MKTKPQPIIWILILLVIGTGEPTALAQNNERQTPIKFHGGWILSPAQRGIGRGRVSLPKDPLEWARLQGKLAMPVSGSTASPSSPGLNDWRWIESDEQGGFADRELGRGWLAVEVDRERAGIWLLDVRGAANVRVNGTPRGGDVYSNGSTEIPIALEAGKNWLIFSGARGRISATLTQPTRDVTIKSRDSTFPQVIRGEPEDLWGALMVANATQQIQSGYRLQLSALGMKTTTVDIPPLLPLATRKVPFRLPVDPVEFAKIGENMTSIVFNSVLLPPEYEKLGGENNQSARLEYRSFNWEIRSPQQPHIRTFQSQIDGSVQYYAVVPPTSIADQSAPRPGLVLALHGAGVEGSGHAATYAPKPDLYVIAPTNRRNFGFDWEDWGRWDALEVLELAEQRFQTDRQRTYLTGHSMGGHGTWHLGTLFPDRFASIGPSAGWISFSTYAGGDNTLGDDPLSQIMKRANSAGDTLARVENLKQQGVYILHGDRDDNVPVTQARTMRKTLAEFHPDFVYKEQPGAGHWWGNACCDWPAMFQFFAVHQIPLSHQVRSVQFVTPNPAASSRCHRVTISAQQTMGALSRIDLAFDPTSLTLRGTTENVSRLRIDTVALLRADGVPPNPVELKCFIDGSELTLVPADWNAEIVLQRTEDHWDRAEPVNGSLQKRPERGSGFKEAFRNRFMLVYGTGGDEAENRWMLERARFDAETFRYRGNASVDVVSDQDWLAHAVSGKADVSDTDRGIVVYGNATINSAWAVLLAESPVRMERRMWQVAGRVERVDAQSILMVRPRPGSEIASVAAIGGTELIAMQATDRIPIFSAGTAFPDLLLTGPDFLERGYEAVQFAGFFGNDWGLESGQWYEAGVDMKGDGEGE